MLDRFLVYTYTKEFSVQRAVGYCCMTGDTIRYAATSTILISAFLRSAHLERAAHYREFSVARLSLPLILRRTRLYQNKVVVSF